MATITSPLDYFHGLLNGLLTSGLTPQQSILHTTERVNFSKLKSNHVNPLLETLQWFSTQSEIQSHCKCL